MTTVVGAAADTLTMTTNDLGNTGSGGAKQDVDTIQIDLTAVNDAPVVTAPGSALSATEQVNLSIEGTGFSVTDVDEAGAGATATLNVGEGVITVVIGNSGVTIDSGNGTGTVALSGTIAQINNLLNDTSTGTITYLNSSDTPSASTTFTVTAPSPTFKVAANLTTRLQVSNGVVSVTLSGTATISLGANGSGDMTIQGSLTDINATLTSLTYTGNTDVVGTAADTLTMTTNDLGNTGSGGAKQDVDTIQIDLTAVNDAPVVTAPGSALSATEQVNLSIEGTGFAGQRHRHQRDADFPDLHG